MKWLFVLGINFRYFFIRHTVILIIFCLSISTMILGLSLLAVHQVNAIFSYATVTNADSTQIIIFENTADSSKIETAINKYLKEYPQLSINNMQLYSPQDDETGRFIIGRTTESSDMDLINEGSQPELSGDVFLFSQEYSSLSKVQLLGEKMRIMDEEFTVCGTGFFDWVNTLMNLTQNYNKYNLKITYSSIPEVKNTNSPIWILGSKFMEMDLPCFGFSITFSNKQTPSQISRFNDLLSNEVRGITFDNNKKVVFSENDIKTIRVEIIKAVIMLIVCLFNIWILLHYWIQSQKPIFKYYRIIGAKNKLMHFLYIFQIMGVVLLPTIFSMLLYYNLFVQLLIRFDYTYILQFYWFFVFYVLLCLMGIIFCYPKFFNKVNGV